MNFQTLAYDVETYSSTTETNSSTAETIETVESQIERTEIDYGKKANTDILHLSQSVDEIALNLIKIAHSVNAEVADELEDIAKPLYGILVYTWASPMDEKFQRKLYYLLDKIMDINKCIFNEIDDAYGGSPYVIESKMHQMSISLLRIVDVIKSVDNDGQILEMAEIREQIIELTMYLVSLTSVITLITHLITNRDNEVSVIVGTIASLVVIHQYITASVACLLYQVEHVTTFSDLTQPAGMGALKDIIVNFISKLGPSLKNNPKATKTELFHGDVHFKLSKELLMSIRTWIGNRLITKSYTLTTSLVKVIEEHAPQEFHVLPDLMSELTIILLRCFHVGFYDLEGYTTYSFDGLFDVLRHFSKRLDKQCQSSASTGSFHEPSLPIDIAVANIRAVVKRFINESQDTEHKSTAKTSELNVELITRTSELMEVVLNPMFTLIDKYDSTYTTILTLCLQFIGLYVVGLTITPLISARTYLKNFSGNSFSEFEATLSLALVNVGIVFDYTSSHNVSRLAKKLHSIFDDLFEELKQLNGGFKSLKETATSIEINGLIDLIKNRTRT